eukprot:1161568-Pelagomonas_calceolata.AAC.11
MHTQVVATDPAEVLEDITVPKRESDISAWVNVIYGCNEKCSYCVVPYTRWVIWCLWRWRWRKGGCVGGLECACPPLLKAGRGKQGGGHL